MGMTEDGFCQTVSIGNHTFDLIGHSVNGSDEKVNQDSYGYYCDGDSLIVVVADGLGSAPLSQIGSEAVVIAAMEVLSEPEPGNIWRHIFETWMAEIDGPLEQYDTTCKFIRIRDDKVIVGSIGDGWLGMINSEGYTELENNNLFTNRTESICSQKLMDKAYTAEYDLDQLYSFGVSTDGFSEDFDRVSRSEFLRDVCENMANDIQTTYGDIKAILGNWPVKSNKDDKTVILVRKVE